LFQVLTTEAVQGAKKFLAGLGRGGKFNVNQGGIPSLRMFKECELEILDPVFYADPHL
jgi:hypothetical protein